MVSCHSPRRMTANVLKVGEGSLKSHIGSSTFNLKGVLYKNFISHPVSPCLLTGCPVAYLESFNCRRSATAMARSLQPKKQFIMACTDWDGWIVYK